MSKQYVVKKGDYLRKISWRFYGTPYQWRKIYKASNFRSGNPDLIYPGEIAIIPDLADKPKQQLRPLEEIDVEDQNQITVMLNGKNYTGWIANNIQRNMDTCSDGFSLDVPWTPEVKEYVDNFKPFAYQDIRLYIGNDILLNGKIDQLTTTIEDNQRNLNIQGRTITAVLVDTSINNYPLQYRNLNLEDVAKKVVEPYGLGVDYQVEKIKIKRATAENGQSPYDFLKKLCRKYGVLISSSLDGELRLYRANANQKPVVSLIEGDGPFLSASAVYNGTKRFSAYSARAQGVGGRNRINQTVQDNTINYYRPLVFDTSDVDDGRVKDAANWKKSNALAEAIKINVNVIGWRKPDGSLWQENEMVSMRAPSIMVFDESKFLTKSVSFVDDTAKGRTTTLGLIIPEAYTLDFPENFFWE